MSTDLIYLALFIPNHTLIGTTDFNSLYFAVFSNTVRFVYNIYTELLLTHFYGQALSKIFHPVNIISKLMIFFFYSALKTLLSLLLFKLHFVMTIHSLPELLFTYFYQKREYLSLSVPCPVIFGRSVLFKKI